MRLIDPMELKRSIAVAVENRRATTLDEIIDEQPTIEPRKGKWLENEYTSYCSECGENAIEYIESDYCPWCGADMKGEQE